MKVHATKPQVFIVLLLYIIVSEYVDHSELKLNDENTFSVFPARLLWPVYRFIYFRIDYWEKCCLLFFYRLPEMSQLKFLWSVRYLISHSLICLAYVQNTDRKVWWNFIKRKVYGWSFLINFLCILKLWKSGCHVITKYQNSLTNLSQRQTLWLQT